MSYIGNTPGVSSQRVVLEEVITGSPKSAFTPISGYIKGYVDVLINGVEIDTADFTAADGITVTLGTAAAVGDTVKIKTWLPRGLSDGYLKSEADAKFAPLVNGNLIMAPNAGSNRVIGFASGTDTTLVLQGGGTSGGGANLELTRDARAFLDATTTEIRSLDGSTVYGVFNSTGFGVGTSSPLAKINASGAAGSNMFQSNDTNSTGTFLRMYGDVTHGSVINVKTGDAIRFAHSAQDFSGFTERMRIDPSGNLLVACTSLPSASASSGAGMGYSAAGGNLLMSNTAGTEAIAINYTNYTSGTVYPIVFRANGNTKGFINYNGTLVQYVNSSDERLKTNIVDAPSALPLIETVKVRQFNWIENNELEEFGFIAQELNTVIPNATSVGKDNDDGSIDMPWGVDPSKMVGLCIKAIQEQQAIIEQLRADVEALKG